MYLYISTQDSEQFYPYNECYDFSIELPRELKGPLDIALTFVYLKAKPLKGGYYYLLCDAVEPSFVRDCERPVLGSFYTSGSVTTPKYLRINRESLKRLTFSIRTCQLKVPPPCEKPVYFTLHLISHES